MALSLHRFQKCWDPLKKHPMEGKGEAILQWLPLGPVSFVGVGERGDSGTEKTALDLINKCLLRAY